MVIGIHTYVDGLMHLNLLLRQFLNCAVPIFLAISGYFIGSKSFMEKGSYTRFLGKQIPRVYFPMLFWSVPWIIRSVKDGNNPLFAVLKAFAGDMSIFYFIILIIQFYILTPAIQETNRRISGGYSLVITIAGISLFDYVVRIQGLELSMVQSGSPFPVWMVFYVMGVLKAQGLGIPFQNSRPLVYSSLGMLLCCVHIAWLYRNYGCIAHGIKLSSHIYTYFVIMWLFSDSARNKYNMIKNTRISKYVVKTGVLSFYIYLTHCLILLVMSYIHIPSLWSVKWAVCILLSFMFAKYSERYCSDAIKKYVGL